MIIAPFDAFLSWYLKENIGYKYAQYILYGQRYVDTCVHIVLSLNPYVTDNKKIF